MCLSSAASAVPIFWMSVFSVAQLARATWPSLASSAAGCGHRFELAIVLAKAVAARKKCVEACFSFARLHLVLWRP